MELLIHANKLNQFDKISLHKHLSGGSNRQTFINLNFYKITYSPASYAYKKASLLKEKWPDIKIVFKHESKNRIAYKEL